MAAAVLSFAVWLACGDGDTTGPTPPPPPRPASVTVGPASIELQALADTARLTAEVRDQNGAVMSDTGDERRIAVVRDQRTGRLQAILRDWNGELPTGRPRHLRNGRTSQEKVGGPQCSWPRRCSS